MYAMRGQVSKPRLMMWLLHGNSAVSIPTRLCDMFWVEQQLHTGEARRADRSGDALSDWMSKSSFTQER